MVELDILMVIAQVAVAIAGFSAVVANFSKNWSAQKGKQLSDLLYQSGIVLFASLGSIDNVTARRVHRRE